MRKHSLTIWIPLLQCIKPVLLVRSAQQKKGMKLRYYETLLLWLSQNAETFFEVSYCSSKDVIYLYSLKLPSKCVFYEKGVHAVEKDKVYFLLCFHHQKPPPPPDLRPLLNLVLVVVWCGWQSCVYHVCRLYMIFDHN